MRQSFARLQQGIAHSGVVAVLIVTLVIGAGGYYVYQNNQQAATKQAAKTADEQRQAQARQQDETETIARTDKEQILATLQTYCTTKYKSFWEATYGRTIDTTSVSSSFDDSVPDPFAIEGNYARIQAAKCDTTQLTEAQKFAPFALYFKKQDAAWVATERYQTTPPCADFATDKWPAKVLPECQDGAELRTAIN